MKDILNIEHLQCHATKYLHTILFYQLLQNLVDKTELQDIFNHSIYFTLTTSISILLVLDQVPTINLFLLIIRITFLDFPVLTECHLCGTLCQPVFNILCYTEIRTKTYLWEHLLNHFHDSNNCTL